ncbi:MAG TPA: hypothetical protein VFC67_12190 [Prolixibacteraceae bacterium]|nr:hypothetical protein [Prolixibacteraceae bacterium]
MKLDSNKGVLRNWLKYFSVGFIVVFALIGLFLTTAFFAVKLHVANDPGAVDYNDRYFQELKDKYGQSSTTDSSKVNGREAEFFHNVLVLNKYYPENSLYILNAYLKSKNLSEAERMIGAVNLYMQDNKGYNSEIKDFEVANSKVGSQRNNGSVFEWMNIAEWEDFKLAVAKDKPLIDSVANLTDVEPRLIVAVLVGEQIRLFNSEREAYKKWIGPLKILSVETTFSLGVTGIKIPTALTIERNLKDRESVFYLGEKYEHLLDFQTNNITDERFKRLTSYKNHFYSYLYAALNIKQIKTQWECAGFPIGDRPEILATLYNIGFEVSIPKKNPVVGGSTVMIHRKPYSFGAIAYEYYYSGELYDLFPFKRIKFDWNNG